MRIRMERFKVAPGTYHPVANNCLGGDSCRCLSFNLALRVVPAFRSDARADFEATTRAVVKGEA